MILTYKHLNNLTVTYVHLGGIIRNVPQCNSTNYISEGLALPVRVAVILNVCPSSHDRIFNQIVMNKPNAIKT